MAIFHVTELAEHSKTYKTHAYKVGSTCAATQSTDKFSVLG